MRIIVNWFLHKVEVWAKGTKLPENTIPMGSRYVEDWE